MVENEVAIGMEEDTQKDKYLCFQLENTEYALPIRYVIEIIGIQRITTIPDVPAYVKGVVNLRGKIIPVIDVRARFRFEERVYDDRTCIIVVNIKETSVGLIVDSVNEVLDIPETQIQLPPKLKKGLESRYISGLGKVGNSVKIIINMDTFLFDEEVDKINQEEEFLS